MNPIEDMHRRGFIGRYVPELPQLQKMHRELLQALYARGIMCLHDGREWLWL